MPLYVNGLKLPILTAIAGLGQLIMLVWFVANINSAVEQSTKDIQALKKDVRAAKSQITLLETEVEILIDRAARESRPIREQNTQN